MEAIRSNVALVLNKFRACKAEDDIEYEIKEGNKIFGSIQPKDSQFLVRFTSGGTRHVFVAESVQIAINTIAVYVLFPRKILAVKEDIRRLMDTGASFFELYALGGLDKDLGTEHLLRNNRRMLDFATKNYADCAAKINRPTA